ncbi:MAG: zinc ribbon domain-containing protein, partial [Chloroflexota bacterium]|nr:zinc ribbon domain-containing protein [Chloroflexota bacterium]
VEPPRVEAPPRLVPRPAPTPTDHPALAARKASLDLLGLDDPGVGTVPAQRGNVLPYRSSGAAANASDLAQRIGPSPLWDASAREVAAALSAVGVQSCGECGLSLSASARFCRRCGTQQARSA